MSQEIITLLIELSILAARKRLDDPETVALFESADFSPFSLARSRAE